MWNYLYRSRLSELGQEARLTEEAMEYAVFHKYIEVFFVFTSTGSRNENNILFNISINYK